MTSRAGLGEEAPDPFLSIGVFARRSRLSMKALRLYDRLGLLAPDHVDPDSGYRRYRESQLATARLVVMLRRLDMPLAQVAELVAAPPARAADLIEAYWAGVERRTASQRELAAHVRERLLGTEAVGGELDVRVRDIPEQVVLCEQGHMQVDKLSTWIGTALRRLIGAAKSVGGVVGPVFVVYHGEVNEDSDGPVEACVPVASTAEGTVGLARRREPAHRQAYVRLRKAQVEFPQILSAFDGVAQWIGAQGLSIAASPREVYFTDFLSAAPGDEVCDVAFPIRDQPASRPR
jgi:DNA-binding transcriptional MerR regulator